MKADSLTKVTVPAAVRENIFYHNGYMKKEKVSDNESVEGYYCITGYIGLF